MPLVVPLQPPTSISDEDLRALEPSTILVEVDRLEKSLAKLKESQELLQEFESAEDRSEAEREELKGVREENEGVISRQTLLLDRLRTELEAKGGVQAARMDPHVMAVRGSGSGSSRGGGDDDGDVHMR